MKLVKVLHSGIYAPEAGEGTTVPGFQGNRSGFPKWDSSFLQGIDLSHLPSHGCGPWER